MKASSSLRTRKVSPNSLKNLEPRKWKPGQSGNPGGRPKADLSKEMAQAVFENNPEAIYLAMCKRLMKGDVSAFREYASRGYGAVPQKVTADVNITTDPTERFRELVAGILERSAGESDAGRE